MLPEDFERRLVQNLGKMMGLTRYRKLRVATGSLCLPLPNPVALLRNHKAHKKSLDCTETRHRFRLEPALSAVEPGRTTVGLTRSHGEQCYIIIVYVING